MEAAGQGYGWILYEHMLPAGSRGSATLGVRGTLRDLGLVFVDRRWQGTLGWEAPAASTVDVRLLGKAQVVHILVENKARPPCACSLPVHSFHTSGVAATMPRVWRCRAKSPRHVGRAEP